MNAKYILAVLAIVILTGCVTVIREDGFSSMGTWMGTCSPAQYRKIENLTRDFMRLDSDTNRMTEELKKMETAFKEEDNQAACEAGYRVIYLMEEVLKEGKPALEWITNLKC